MAQHGPLLHALCAAARLGSTGDTGGSDDAALRCGAWVVLEALFSNAGASNPGGDASMATLFKSLKLDADFVIESWESMATALDTGSSARGIEDDAIRVLRVLAHVASCIPAAKASSIAANLLEMLNGFKIRPAMAGAALQALKAVCFAKSPSVDEGGRVCSQWIAELLQESGVLLESFIFPMTQATESGIPSVETLQCVLHLVGEIAMLGIAVHEQQGQSSTLSVPVSSTLVSLVQALLPPTLPQSDAASPAPPVPEAVRAHAFIALGKLCLFDQKLAKESINLLVRELVKADSVAVRSNALLVLSDLCVRYTALVDNHVPVMATCLQDPHPLVRRHALLLISQLLVQDYVKWRGLLLHRFLSTLVDPNDDIAQLAEYTLCMVLLRKQPGLFVSNFVDALFVLNGLRGHAKYQAALRQGAKGTTAVTMDGIELGGDAPAQRERRMRIYRLQLQNMSDEHRIQVTAKLAQEVLAAAVDGSIAVTSAPHGADGADETFDGAVGACVLGDAIAILRCDEIRVVGRDGAGGPDADAGDFSALDEQQQVQSVLTSSPHSESHRFQS